MTITAAAQAVGRHPSSIRRLEKQGIIPPAARDWAGERYYTVADVERIRSILYPAAAGRDRDLVGAA
jgi:DNA-binding transcriptional MerR regulator